MTLRIIVRDFRESFGNLPRRNFEAKISRIPGLSGHHRGKSLESSDKLQDNLVVIQQSSWASLPPEFFRDVLKRLEQDNSNWPFRKDVVACASVCTTWRDMCKNIVRNPEFCGKLLFPVSLKQPGPRDGFIQCFHKKGQVKANLSSLPVPYLWSNFFGTKFIIYDTQPPYNARPLCLQEPNSRRFSSRKVSPNVLTGSYPIAQVNYELNVLGARAPRQMKCTMHSIPTSAVDPGGIVPGQPKELLPRLFQESFPTATSSYSIAHHSTDTGSSCFSEFGLQDGNAGDKDMHLVLRNRLPRWHTQLRRWGLNFHGRVTVASVKNFQLIAASAPPATGAAACEPPSQPRPVSPSSSSDHDTVILQFGKVSKDTFTMDYRYPLSAFQAFAICLTSFDTQVGLGGRPQQNSNNH